ncbi:hypothetical protein GALMADRAFT_118766 [Galerina marginata CBS 339.88]|uniref:HSF-type DNA-binding domain-containing protein n=1 Tax=Galerina marginata (strain CBS 339.88) TaxID=685588 RepID=A0A067TDA5_GALM3|nr:hypothetical protein GALMADRAFT_118766 [Galerina marginata CBS 339.88]
MAYNNEGDGASSLTIYPPPKSAEDSMASTSDFVRKLYKILEDPSFESIVSWGPAGDCFIVKDMNEFTTAILPRMFKHSNFASFVRQLNKYDFHKVKNADEDQFSWTFRHPDFHAHRRDGLENIKRKAPSHTTRRAVSSDSLLAPGNPSSFSAPHGSRQSLNSNSASLESNPNYFRRPRNRSLSPSPAHTHLIEELKCLNDDGEDMKARIRRLEREYEGVLVEVDGFRRGMKQREALMQSLITYFLTNERGGS